MARKIIADLIKKNIALLQKEGVLPKFAIAEINVERTANPQFGDFTTNVAMRLVGLVHQNPVEIANLIKNKIQADRAAGLFKRIESAGPGFINFFLADRYFQERVPEILKAGKKYGANGSGKGKKIQVEFISANPTGPLHLGNGRGGAIGNALAGVLGFSGYKVEREYYVNDRGNQVKMLGASTSAGSDFLRRNRLEGANYQGQYIKDWEAKHQKLVKKYGNNLEKLGRLMARDFLDSMIKPVIKKFGVKFDKWFSEKFLYDNGTVEKILKVFKKENFSYEKDGALWFRAKNFGDDDDRVLIKSDGEATYFLSDLAYHWNKFGVRKFNRVIDIWGADHYGYVGRMKSGLAALKIPEDRLAVIIMQLVRLVEGGKEIRMSKRAGNFVTLEELIDEVGSDVAKFFFLMSSPDSHMDFDLALAKEKSEKNPVYYVQYAHARICSILKKSKIQNSKSKINTKYKIQNTKYKLLNHPSEMALIRELDYFPELVCAIAGNYEVHKLTHFAVNLARSFHAFYRDCRVVGEQKPLMEARLGLIMATQTVLKNVLSLIGVTAPERM